MIGLFSSLGSPASGLRSDYWHGQVEEKEEERRVLCLSLEVPPLVGCKVNVSLRARNPWDTQVILVVEHSIPHDIPGFYDSVQTLFSVKKWIVLNLILVQRNRNAVGEYFCEYFSRQSLCKLSNSTDSCGCCFQAHLYECTWLRW